MYYNRYIGWIEQDGGINPIIANFILRDHILIEQKMLENYERYIQYKVPIKDRELPENTTKINNKLINDFFSEIIDTKVGYMFGEPVTYFLDSNAPNYEAAIQKMQQFRKLNNLDDLNAETGKYAAISGMSAMLCYIDEDGMERVMRVDPWECVFISDYEISQPRYAIRYYWVYENDGQMRRLKVHFYDDKNVTTLIGDNAGILEILEESKPHGFDYCPLFGIPNNNELLSDGEKVFSLIDAYDRTMSDLNSEIEQFRLAYMMFIGYEPDEDALDKMRQTGALWIPTADSGEDIKFLTKTIDNKTVEGHLDRLEKNILRFANHVNFSDEHFSGNLSGVAMKFKLFALETKAKMFERKHEAATRYLFKVIGSAWSKKGFDFDVNLLDIKYSRNVPINAVDEANAASSLNGIISKKTLLGQLSFINDVEEELRNIEDEKQDMVNLDDPELNLKTPVNTDSLGQEDTAIVGEGGEMIPENNAMVGL